MSQALIKEENDCELIVNLHVSFTNQLHLYCQLRDITQKILGKLTMSRGDISAVMGIFNQKKALMEQIEVLRQKVSPLLITWQARKEYIPENSQKQSLSETFGQTENAIRGFLDSEEQLKKYLEQIMKKDC